ncbi:MAG: C-GCAxxG-C-C family protein, partial [Firmicutes bacterium]|nr:C-GCAxxG-C-C family protein [Bacillota bacterium]
DDNKADEAVTCFDGGFNCAQAVLSAYCGELGLDRETALKLACGFGAGMGRLQGTCGAVAGAYMLIGLKYGQYTVDDKQAREKTYALVREFAGRFGERNGTTVCRDILGVDLINGDRQTASERVRAMCPKMVRDAAEIVRDILYKPEKA